MFKKLLALLRGLDFAPLAVSLARGVLEAAVMAGLIETLVLFQLTQWGDAWWAVGVIYGIRQAEGLADHIDPAKRRVP